MLQALGSLQALLRLLKLSKSTLLGRRGILRAVPPNCSGEQIGGGKLLICGIFASLYLHWLVHSDTFSTHQMLLRMVFERPMLRYTDSLEVALCMPEAPLRYVRCDDGADEKYQLRQRVSSSGTLFDPCKVSTLFKQYRNLGSAHTRSHHPANTTTYSLLPSHPHTSSSPFRYSNKPCLPSPMSQIAPPPTPLRPPPRSATWHAPTYHPVSPAMQTSPGSLSYSRDHYRPAL